MTLLKPILLTGALLVAIPIAIHLLNRNRYRVERFGAMIFLRQAMIVKARKIRLWRWLQLLLRCLIIILLAVAFARPVVGYRDGASGDEPVTHVVIIDGSLSMGQGEGVENAFHQARESALRLVESMGEADNMQIIWGASRPSPLFPAPVFDRIQIRNRIRALSPLATGMNLPAALEQAFWAADASTLPRRRIYLLTDGQAHAWRLADELAWQRLVSHWRLLALKPSIYVWQRRPGIPVENLAVARLTTRSSLVDTFRPARLVCELRNYGAAATTTTARFLVDGRVREERRLTLPVGRKTVYFEHQFNEPGSHYASVRIDADALPVDDRLSTALQVVRRLRILIVEGRSDDNPWLSDSGFLRLALEAGVGRDGEDGGLFEMTLLPQAEMDTCGMDFLAGFQAVILANVASLSDYFTFALERYAETGGGILVTVGEGAEQSAYARIFKAGQGILPARLEHVETYDKRFFQPLLTAAGVVDALDYLTAAGPRILPAVKVAKYWRVRPAEASAVFAHFDGAPFLVYRPFGAGRVVLSTIPLTAEWSNIAMTAEFLPLVRSLVIFLSASGAPRINLKPGETIVYSAGHSTFGGPSDSSTVPSPNEVRAPVCHVRLPTGETRILELSRRRGEWFGYWEDTDAPGLYTFESDVFPVQHFAVEPDAADSDLTPLSAAEMARLRALPMGLNFVDGVGELSRAIEQDIGGREWWQLFALAALALICLDCLGFGRT